MRVMIFGCGYSGQAIAEAFIADGATVSGTVRSEEKAVALRAKGIRPFIFDGSDFDGALPGEMAEVTHLVQSIPPGHRDYSPMQCMLHASETSLASSGYRKRQLAKRPSY